MNPSAIPWGNVPWILRRTGLNRLRFLGAVSAEDRSLAILDELARDSAAISSTLLAIRDSDDESRDLGKGRREALVRDARRRFNDVTVIESELFADEDEIFRIADEFALDLASEGADVFLDISALPKRFFFPLVRQLVAADSIRNLIVGYSQPAQYASTDLGIDPTPGYALPGFGEPYPTPDHEVIIVGGGFNAPGFLGLFESYYERDVRVMVLIPFPSDAPRYNRIWQFTREIEESGAVGKIETLPTPLHDVGLTTSRLRGLTDFGKRYAIMLPYGPKTVSLAMCLAHIGLQGSPTPPSVVYAQPTSYVEDYSTGIAQVGGRVVAHCYPIKLDGNARF